MNAIQMTPVGIVRASRSEPVDDRWDSVKSRIELDPQQFAPNATAGLSDFSHIEVIYHFHLVGEDEVEKGARHPRGRKDFPLAGVFAQRGKGRPNRIGVCICRLLSVDGLNMSVYGLDAIDGTPVLDIKPVMLQFLPRGAVREPHWAQEIMKDYW